MVVELSDCRILVVVVVVVVVVNTEKTLSSSIGGNLLRSEILERIIYYNKN